MADMDLIYYSLRAEAERLRADRSVSVEQRRAHEELRTLYLARCDGNERATGPHILAEATA